MRFGIWILHTLPENGADTVFGMMLFTDRTVLE